MELLDSTVTNTAAPSIRADLSGSYAELQWMSAAYTMALAVMLLIGGRLGDIFGRGRMLLVGVAGFTLASVICAMAATPVMLIMARGLQGAFGAVMLPQGFGLVRDLFPPAERKQAWTVFGPVLSLSAVLGPVLAGALIHADLLGYGWRMIFLINVPIGAFALSVAARFLPASARRASVLRASARRASVLRASVLRASVLRASARAVRQKRLDPLGVVLAAASTFMLIFPLVQGRELGWPTWVKALLIGAVPVIAAFGWQQRRHERSGTTSLIETSVFSHRRFTSGVAFSIVLSGAIGGSLLILGVFMQAGLGYSPLRAGLTSMPWALGAMLGSGVSGALMARLGRSLLHIGLTAMSAGLAVLYAVLVHAGPGIGSADFIAPLLTAGIGMGVIFAPLFHIILGDVADAEVGSAASVLQAAQQLGASLGVAVIGTAFFGLAGMQAQHNFDVFAGPGLRSRLASAAVPAASRDRMIARVRACVQDREAEMNPQIVPASCRALRRVLVPAASGAVTAADLDTHVRDSVDAAKATTLITLALIALTFAIGFLLPANARFPAGAAG